MITKLYAHNYKTLINFDINLSPLTLIVGANGSGKSSILEILFALSSLSSENKPLREIFPAWTLSKFLRDRRQKFRIEVNLGTDIYQYEVTILQDVLKKTCFIENEYLSVNGDILTQSKLDAVEGAPMSLEGSSMVYTGGLNSALRLPPFLMSPEKYHKLNKFRFYLKNNIITCRINPFNIQTLSESEESDLNPDAGNFVSWYRARQNERLDLTHQLLIECQSFIQNLKIFSLESYGPDIKQMKVVFKENHSLGFHELSEGQKCLIILYSLLILNSDFGSEEVDKNFSKVLIIDEPENFISLKEIQPWLRTVEDWIEQGNGQVILISHNPETMDYEGDDNIVWFEREDGQHTRLKSREEIAAGHGLLLSDRFSRES